MTEKEIRSKYGTGSIEGLFKKPESLDEATTSLELEIMKLPANHKSALVIAMVQWQMALVDEMVRDFAKK